MVIAALCGAGPALAQTTHTVNLSGSSFTPATSMIQAGDTVHWVWLEGQHNVVSGVGGVPDGNFNSGAPVFGATFDVLFDQAFLDANPMPNNEYPYYCDPHLPLGMTGTIIVEAVEDVPAVSEWGVMITALMILLVGTGLLRRGRVASRTA